MRATSTANDALWQRYAKHRDPEARAQLLDRNLQLVRNCARDIARRVGYAVDLGDLVGAGTLGLLQALEGFDLTRGLAFSTYAAPRIRGAILDELRSRDWRPRSVRAKSRQLSAVVSRLVTHLGRIPEATEIAAAIGINLESYYRLKEAVEGGVMVSLCGYSARGGEDALSLEETLGDAANPAPLDAVGQAQVVERLRAAVAELSPRERTVLSLYYYDELNLKEIGEVLRLTESRVSQIRTAALRRLRQCPVLAAEEL